VRAAGLPTPCCGEGLAGFNPISSVISGGSLVIGSVLDLPGEVLEQIQRLADGFFERFKDFTGDLADALKAGWDEVFRGIRLIAEIHWRYFTENCRFFRQFRDLVNIGVQAYSGDLARAGSNLVAEASEALGRPVPAPRSEHAAIKGGAMVCDAIETVDEMARAAGEPLPGAPELSEAERIQLLARDVRFRDTGKIQELSPDAFAPPICASGTSFDPVSRTCLPSASPGRRALKLGAAVGAGGLLYALLR